MIAAPHTSSWDVPLLILYGWAFDLPIRWMMKAEMFRGWRGPFFKSLGGIPIDRSQRHNMVQQCVDILNAADRMVVVVPPEGTRAAAKGWKTGFYYIALGARLPIALGYLDFARKEGGFGPPLYPTGDIEADFAVLRAFYQDKKGKYPEKFGPIQVAPREDSRSA
jgi:1-acyl-sn-glycerol-3-phosphate acyltransferase